MTPEEEIDLTLSVNRALWGEVGPALRTVIARLDEKLVRLRFYFDCEPSYDDRNSASCTGAETIADYACDHHVEEQIIRLDAPTRIPHEDGWIVIFMRRETYHVDPDGR